MFDQIRAERHLRLADQLLQTAQECYTEAHGFLTGGGDPEFIEEGNREGRRTLELGKRLEARATSHYRKAAALLVKVG